MSDDPRSRNTSQSPARKAPGPASARPESREDRLKAALKANMARRKAQARARAEGGATTATADDATIKGE